MIVLYLFVLYLFVLFLLVQLELRLVGESLRAVGAAVGLDARVALHVRPQTLLTYSKTGSQLIPEC